MSVCVYVTHSRLNSQVKTSDTLTGCAAYVILLLPLSDAAANIIYNTKGAYSSSVRKLSLESDDGS